MPFFKKAIEGPPGEDATEQGLPERLGGPELLRDRGLLAEWFVRYRLDEEMARSRRKGYPLSAALLQPMLLNGERSAMPAVFAGVAAAEAASRTPDLLCWLADNELLVVLLDTDEVGATAAIRRWRSEMWTKSTYFGGVKWRAAVVPDDPSYTSSDQLVEAARARLVSA